MAEFDLVVRGGEVATGFGTTRCDIGVKDGRIVALGEKLADGTRVVDAAGTLVLPGGVDSHCHIEEPSRGGYASTGQAEPPLTVNEESFATASTAASPAPSPLTSPLALAASAPSPLTFPLTSAAPKSGAAATLPPSGAGTPAGDPLAAPPPSSAEV